MKGRDVWVCVEGFQATLFSVGHPGSVSLALNMHFYPLLFSLSIAMPWSFRAASAKVIIKQKNGKFIYLLVLSLVFIHFVRLILSNCFTVKFCIILLNFYFWFLFLFDFGLTNILCLWIPNS